MNQQPLHYLWLIAWDFPQRTRYRGHRCRQAGLRCSTLGVQVIKLGS
nr:MAG TPA: hypothetical protein [Caudoviricetes sp.]